MARACVSKGSLGLLTLLVAIFHGLGNCTHASNMRGVDGKESSNCNGVMKTGAVTVTLHHTSPEWGYIQQRLLLPLARQVGVGT